MVLERYTPLPDFFEGNGDRGTPRNIEDADYQAFIEAKGTKRKAKVTDFTRGNRIILDGDFEDAPKANEPQSTIRTDGGALGFGVTRKRYGGNPFFSSITEAYRWINAQLSGKPYISPVSELEDVGSPTWNEFFDFTDLGVGLPNDSAIIKDYRGKEVKINEARPVIFNALTNDYEMIREPLKIEIKEKTKKTFNGPEYINVSSKKGDKLENIVNIERKHYKLIAPLRSILEGYTSKHENLEKILKPLYGIPILIGGEINSGLKATVGDENDSHVLYESKSDFIRLGQLLKRPKTYVDLYDGTFRITISPEFTFWSALQLPINPKYLKGYFWNKKVKGRESNFRERRHEINFFSILTGIDIRGENGYGGRIDVTDELIYSDLLYTFTQYTPEGEKDIGHIVLKRKFDESEAIVQKAEQKKVYNSRTKRNELVTVNVPYVDTDKVKCDYSVNVCLEEGYEKKGVEIMNMMIALTGELQEKLRLGYQNLESFEADSLPTNLGDGLDMIATSRNLNYAENWINKALNENITPESIYHVVKDLFGIEPPEQFKKHIKWDRGRNIPAKWEGQMTLDEIGLIEKSKEK